MTVLVFARLRELLGTGSVEIPWRENLQVATLREWIAQQWPESTRLLSKSLVAINNEYVANDRLIQPDDVIAIIPPVSGG